MRGRVYARRLSEPLFTAQFKYGKVVFLKSDKNQSRCPIPCKDYAAAIQGTMWGWDMHAHMLLLSWWRNWWDVSCKLVPNSWNRCAETPFMIYLLWKTQFEVFGEILFVLLKPSKHLKLRSSVCLKMSQGTLRWSRDVNEVFTFWSV